MLKTLSACDSLFYALYPSSKAESSDKLKHASNVVSRGYFEDLDMHVAVAWRPDDKAAINALCAKGAVLAAQTATALLF